MVKVHKLIMVQDSNTGTGQKYKVDKGVDIVYTVLYCTVYCTYNIQVLYNSK